MAGVSKVDRSIKIVLDSVINKIINGELDLDKNLYTFIRDYTINYFNSDKNKSLKEAFTEYKLSDAYTGEERKNKKEKMIDIEMDIGNMYQKEDSNGVEKSTVINLLEGDNPLIHEIENVKKYMLMANYSDKAKREVVFELLRNAAYVNETWKINEEINNYQLRHNGLTLKETLEYSNAKVRENVYEILGNGENVQNSVVRDAGVKAIGKATVQMLKNATDASKSERNGYLVKAIEELQDRRNEEKYEKTRVLSGGKEYEFTQEEEMIAQYPELLDIYPALKYKFNEDGTKKSIIQEVNYGLNKINEMNERSNGENEESLEGKKNQIYDLINEDFILALSKSEDKEKFMKHFVSSLGVNESKKYLKQVQNWQKNKDKILEKEKIELEKELEMDRKIVSENTDLEKADDFIDEVAKGLKEKDINTIIVKYINKDVAIDESPEIQEYEEIEKTSSDIFIDLNEYIGNEEQYKVDDDELEKLEKDEREVQRERKNEAKKIYKYKKEKALEKDPAINEREEKVAKEIKEKSVKAKNKEKQRQENEKLVEEKVKNQESINEKKDKEEIIGEKGLKDEKTDSRDVQDNNIIEGKESGDSVIKDTVEEKNKEAKKVENVVYYPEEEILIEDEREVQHNNTDIKPDYIEDYQVKEENEKIEESKFEEKRRINGYTTGDYSRDGFEDGKDGQRRVKMQEEGMDNKIEFKPEDYKSNEPFESKITNTFEEITKENQMNMDEWKEEKSKQDIVNSKLDSNQISDRIQMEEEEYSRLNSTEERVKFLEEHDLFRKLKAEIQLNELRKRKEDRERVLEKNKYNEIESDELSKRINSLYISSVEKTNNKNK